jgi:transcriptional regulator with XRE-family HTH domain
MSDLVARRRGLGWSQDQLAAEAGVSSRTVWSAEHGRHVGERSAAAIELALAQAEKRVRTERPGGRFSWEVPFGKVVLELATPDGMVRLAAAVDPGTRVDVDDVRRRLLEIREVLTAEPGRLGAADHPSSPRPEPRLG